MYSQFLGLHKNPFSQLTRQNDVFLPGNHQLVFNHLAECLEKSTGVVGLFGPAGVGKSILIAHLVEVLLQDNQAVVFKDLSILIEAEEQSGSMRDNFSSVIEAVFEDSTHNVDSPHKSIYLLDGADSIDEDALVKLLKIIASRNASGSPALLILVGREHLEQMLNIARHALDSDPYEDTYYLDALNVDEVRDYIQHRMCSVHYSGEPLFAENAINAIALLSKGIPRHINTVCGMSLFQADQEQLSIIAEKEIYEAGESHLLEAGSDLQSSVETQPFDDAFVRNSDIQGPTTDRPDDRESIIIRTDKTYAADLSEPSTQVDSDESDTLQRETEQSDSPDPISVSAGNADQSARDRESPVQYLGVIAVILFVVIVLTVERWHPDAQLRSGTDAFEIPDKPDQFQTTEMSQDIPVTHSEGEPTQETETLHTAFSVVDFDHAGDFQGHPAESQRDVPQDKIQDLLSQAREQERKRQLTSPENNNAVTTYRHILDLQSGNVAAAQGIERIKQQFIQQAKRAIAQSQWKAARTYLFKAKWIDPHNHVIDTLLADIRTHQLQDQEVIHDHSVDQQELAAKNRADARYQLVEKGINFDLADFFLYAEQGDTDLVVLFLDANMPVDIQDTYSGDTALIKALTYGHLETAKSILDRHANVDIQNHIGRTALMSAIVFERYTIVPDILNQATDINISDQGGWNALMFAVQKNQPILVEALLKRGADIHARNILGQSALSIAQEYNHNTIVSLLQSTH